MSSDRQHDYRSRNYRSATIPEPRRAHPNRLVPTRSLDEHVVELARGHINLRTIHEPQDPILELILVHGLMGDSRLSWTLDNDDATFWPDWLAEDEQFRTMRIHTWGYKETRVGDKVALSGLKDTGKDLCESIEQNRSLGSGQNPIIFIAHSLGGTMVKAAVSHARDSEHLQHLSRRFHSILFLATPHYDTDDRQMIQKILETCNTATQFLPTEIEANMSVIRDINQDFYTSMHDLRLYSFYENGRRPIVPKRAAIFVTDLDHEKPVPVNADHADVIRFRDSNDPTYQSIAEILRHQIGVVNEDFHNPGKLDSIIKSLASCLDADDADEEDLEVKEASTVPGTCEWILNNDLFIQWRDRGPHNPASQIYWLTGDPGSGKSFIAAHVVRHLRIDKGRDVSFYFLKHGDQSKQQISGLLKSMTLQTARRSADLRRSLMALQKDDPRETFQVDKSDVHGISKQLLKRTFDASLEKRQYWVIDALDEAIGGGEKLLNVLSKLPSNFSVFITCRPDMSLTRAQRVLGELIMNRQITPDDTRQDIMLYLEKNDQNLPVADGDPAKVQSVIRDLTKRSQGSFLWTSLIVQELEDCYDDAMTQNILSNVPTGMHYRYQRMFENINQRQRPHNVELARNIIRWVITSTRPMRLAELRGALHSETKGTVFNLQRAVETICSPALKIVGNDRVEVIHDTARDYLFNKDKRSGADVVPGFSFDKTTSHEHLAIICVEALCERYRAPLRRSVQGSSPLDNEAFIAYASKSFSLHVYKSAQAPESEATKRLVAAIGRFLEAHLTAWIESQAKSRTLSLLINTGKNLKAFAARRLSGITELRDALIPIPGWADDMIHLITVFGKDLSRDPGSIHTVIPPLCPKRSKLHGAYSGSGLQVEGLSREHWPDHISSASFGRDVLTAVASSDAYHAVALRSGSIVLFSSTTCQELRRFEISEPVKLMQFVPGNSWIAVSGRRSLTLYNCDDGEMIWTVQTGIEIVALAIALEEAQIITVDREQTVKDYDLSDSRLRQKRRLAGTQAPNRYLQKAYIACDLGLIALLHRNDEVEFYDWPSLRREERSVGHSSHMNALAFNHPKHQIALTSFDGELWTVDAATMRKVNQGEGNAAHMACSPDGKTLVVAENTGDLCIHDFETLDLLHRVRCDDGEIVGLCYSGNDLRFLDIRRSTFNVWEPAVLVRQEDIDDGGSSEGHVTFATAWDEPQIVSTVLDIDNSPITAMAPEHSGDYMFCGREDGSVRIYDTGLGQCQQILRGFGRNEVNLLTWNGTQKLLASADNSSTVRIHRIIVQQVTGATNGKIQWQVTEVAKMALEKPLRQIIFSLEGELLLASSTGAEKVFRTENGQEIYSHENNTSLHDEGGEPHRWVTLPEHRQRFLEVSKDGGHSLSWRADPMQGLRLERQPIQASISTPNRKSSGGAQIIRVPDRSWAVYDNDPNASPFIWSHAIRSHADSANQVMQTLRAFEALAPRVAHIIGIHRTIMIFVDTDNWVCSVPIDRPRYEDEPNQHFPIPHYWRSASRSLVTSVTAKGAVAFAVDGDLVVVKNGLNQQH